jgi:hypothetical protein
MDDFALRAEDTLESREDRPVSLRLAGIVPMGVLARLHVAWGEAAEVSTGSMMPKGADAVVMIEYSQTEDERVQIRRPVFSSENVQAAGSDISFGEAVLFPGTKLAARETVGRVAAGAVAKKLLATEGIEVVGCVMELGGIKAEIASLDLSELRNRAESNAVRCPDPAAAQRMRERLDAVRREGDSLGWVVVITAEGVPAGLDEPVFGKLDADLARALMSIGAVKAVENGAGRECAALRGNRDQGHGQARSGYTSQNCACGRGPGADRSPAAAESGASLTLVLWILQKMSIRNSADLPPQTRIPRRYPLSGRKRSCRPA